MHLVSGYMMVLNEAPFICHAIQSVVDKVDELLVMDCGSTDETMRLLAEMKLTIPKLTVVQQPQKCSRYAPGWDEPGRRNLCISLLRHDWFLALDGDEYLEADRDTFRHATAPAVVNVVNVVPQGRFIVAHRKPGYFRSYSPDLHVRFANRAECSYSNESLHCRLMDVRGQEIVGIPIPVLIWHYNAAYKQLGMMYHHNPEDFVTEEYQATAPIPL